ncbi:hypothetical protein ABIA03_006723 [Bradyrhizobium yuanmingense]|uniref:Transmembrane protein n=2 Tax=Bradyrhizobium yuanmingense TaxID=108015 RepID=A0ABV4GTB3_9BRAD|nr:hypothetical protein [Bradyrhizobium yuanmingense]
MLRIGVGVLQRQARNAFAKNDLPKQQFAMMPFSAPSFFQGDRHTYRRVAVVGTLFCLAFVVISFSLRPQAEDTRVAVKADRLVRTAGQAARAN